MKKLIIILLLILSFNLWGKSYNFNLDALENIDDTQIDIRLLSEDNSVPAGEYLIDIYVNEKHIGKNNILFIMNNNILTPQFTRSQLQQLGLQSFIIEQLTSSKRDRPHYNLLTLIPYSIFSFSVENLSLQLTIPQINLAKKTTDIIDESQWDNGVNVFFSDYYLSGNNRLNGNQTNNHYFVSLNNGINLSAWRFRQTSTYDQDYHQWQNTRFTLSRSIPKIKSQLVLGKQYLRADFITSFNFEGLSLYNEDNLYTQQDREYAPVIYEIAKTAAQVTVRQQGNIIYQTTVPAGPFIIDDLHPFSTQGVLEVTIQENNQIVRKIEYRFSSLTPMLRKGQFRFSSNMGRYSLSTTESSLTIQPNKLFFIHAQFASGLTNHFTGYSDVLISQQYQSILLGSSFSLYPFGAVSSDITQHYSQNKLALTFHLEYRATLPIIGSDINLSGYWFTRPSLTGFTTFIDGPVNNEQKQGLLRFNINQPLFTLGLLNLSLSYYSYPDSAKNNQLINLSYSSSWNNIYYSVHYTAGYAADRNEQERILAFNFMLPLAKLLPQGHSDYTYLNHDYFNNSNVSYRNQFSGNGKQSHQMMINGYINQNNSLNYSYQQDHQINPQSEHLIDNQGSLQYTHENYILNAGYGYGNNQHRINYSLKGAMIAHTSGIYFTPQLGETSALINIPTIKGIALDNQVHTKTDYNGHAVVSHLQPYRLNYLSLDTSTFPVSVEIPDNNKYVIPTKGAFVKVNYTVYQGNKIFFSLKQSNKKSIPFGASASAIVLVENKPPRLINGIVDELGQLYLSGMPNQGKVTINWGAKNQQSCIFTYKLPSIKNNQLIYTITEICQSQSE